MAGGLRGRSPIQRLRPVPRPWPAELTAAPADTAILLRLTGSTLGSGGLSNSGEPVFLVDPLGVTVSSCPGSADNGALPSGGQSVVRQVGSQCSLRGPWELEPSGAATPGWLSPP